jgi:hypothetical protein
MGLMIRRFRDLASQEPGHVLAGLIAVALAAFAVANAIAQMGILILQQHTSTGVAEFHIGRTSIRYDEVLQAVIALGLVGVGLYWGYRLLAPTQQTCPDCLSEIPAAAKVCRYCTSELGEAKSP